MVDPLSKSSRCSGRAPCSRRSSAAPAAGACATPISASRASAPCSMEAAVSRSTARMPLTLEAGDFVLLPTTPGFTMSGFDPVTPTFIDPNATPAPTDEVRHGTPRRRPRRALARRLLRLRISRRGLAGVAAAGGGARARRRAPFPPGAARRRGSERAEVGPRPRAARGSWM